MSTLSYIKNFLKDRNVASVTPSSTFVVKKVARKMDFSQPRVIVEYGPGAGVFSEYFLEHMSADSTLILIEQNEAFVKSLRELTSDSRVHVVHGNAENIQSILDDLGYDKVDYIVSGIPFSFFDPESKRELLDKTYDVLKEEGKFLVYQHYNHMEESLRVHFDDVETEREIRNIPPLCIWEAARRRSAAQEA